MKLLMLAGACTAGGALVAAAGCNVLQDVMDGVDLPTGGLSRVDLLAAPTANQLLSWQCNEYFSSSECDLVGLGNVPSSSALLYSFDLVFDLSNPNTEIPIPLVELLLGLNVFDDANLGAVCVSFCDPDEDGCVAQQDAEGACVADESDGDDPSWEDLIPTVDELIDLADAVASGDVDNQDWRFIPGGEDFEAHIQFDLASDIMVDLADELLGDALDDVLAGRNVSVAVPYQAEGSLFFDLPELGKKTLGFGPFEDQWDLE